jgi:aspartate carbamoyltransferase catalytic subunit
MPGLLSAASLSRADVNALLSAARRYRVAGGRRHDGAVIALVFLEDSLRTRVGFDVAAARLGSATTTVTATRRSTAMWADETPEDMIRSIAPVVDAVCLRHPDCHALAKLVDVPVINCGNGQDEHPTQALIDIFAIDELLGGVDGLRIAMIGDLAGMRSAHSLAYLLARFDDIHVRCIAPAGLGLPVPCVAALEAGGATITQSTTLDVNDVDIVYVAGLPAETSIGVLSAAQQADYRVTEDVVSRMPPHARVLCPLPRVDEIDRDVDESAAAAYFVQAQMSGWMRIAVLDRVLGD